MLRFRLHYCCGWRDELEVGHRGSSLVKNFDLSGKHRSLKDSCTITMPYSFCLTTIGCVCLLVRTASAALFPAVHVVIEPASKIVPRADTATAVELSDGRLLVVYQKYHAGQKSGHDEGYCNIWSKSSNDGGRTWNNLRLLIDVAQGDVNVMNPMLLKLSPRELLLICHRYHHPKPSTSTAVVFRSTDGGTTFSKLAKAWERPPTYRVAIPPLNRLASGRILLAFADGNDNHHFRSMTTYSDDGGRTWTESNHQVQLPKRGALEPSVAQLHNGTLLMSIRTQLGGPYFARSKDQGVTWSAARFSGLEGGESGTCLKRIPNSNRLVLFFNNSKYIPEHHHSGERTPLTVAISDDDGHHWHIVGNLADRQDAEYTNLDCLFTSNGSGLLTYMYAQPAWNRQRIDLRAAVFDVDSLRLAQP